MILSNLKKKFPAAKIDQLSETDFYIEQWNWNYPEALEAQYFCIELAREHGWARFYIFCSHPHVFTMGTGLQRNAQALGLQLIDLTEDQQKQLPFPCYKILRGGGLTFHHPNQLVIYPIVNFTTYHTRSLFLIHGLFQLVQNVLQNNYQLNDLDHHRDLLGLWWKHKKLASAGVGLKHFISHHGLAINLRADLKMNEALKIFAPCGLKGDTYTSLEELGHNPDGFSLQVKQELCHNLNTWMSEEYWRER